MSAPTPPEASPFLDRMILFLMPYFLKITPDFDVARAEILETLASYGARTRSEVLNAVQIIAFGFSALDVLAEAKAIEMSPSMKLRYRGCANSLNRSCQQNEKTLAKRLACDLPDAAPAAEPADDISEAEVQEVLQQTRAKIETYRNRLSGARPATGPHAIPASQPERHNRLWSGAMMDALAGTGAPVQSAAAT
ncbi:MAG: hypothetical protein P4L90_15260 [Rhodopila sp.]|nr:hypothetical protein [Rhodopila sp.]